jgi:serine/threonine protein kinase
MLLIVGIWTLSNGIVKMDIHGMSTHIVRLYETYRESEYYFFVTEKMISGELLDRVIKNMFCNEKEARDTCTILSFQTYRSS